MSPSPGRSTAHASVANQGLATLLVMIAVLAIIILFCCFAAPGIRDICRKLCRCKIDDPDREPGMPFLSLFLFLVGLVEKIVTDSIKGFQPAFSGYCSNTGFLKEKKK